MSYKQDRQGARTPSDLERKYDFERSFAEIMGVAKEAQKSVEETQKKIDAELSLKLGKDDTGKIVSMINAVANEITITSDNFSLTADGTIYARAGNIGGCEMVDGTLMLHNANADGIKAKNVDVSGIITSTEGKLGDVNITTDGLDCGGVTMGTWGLRAINTFDGVQQTVRIVPGGLLFSTSDGSTTYALLEAPKSTSGGEFLRISTNGATYKLYLDSATNTVKFEPVSASVISLESKKDAEEGG